MTLSMNDFQHNYIQHRNIVKLCSTFLIRINQLPDSVTRWQHGSQIWYATFKFWCIANDLATAKARDKNKHQFGVLRNFGACLTKFKNYQILLNKISDRFLVNMKLFIG
jgi:hypothetical protein